MDALLAELSARGGEAAGETGERLVSLLVDFYGAGLARIAELVGPETLLALSADPLVESQLILHGLHPLSADERIELALDRVRPYLGSHAGGVGYLGIDADGVARLRLAGSCTGCASSAVTVRTTLFGPTKLTVLFAGSTAVMVTRARRTRVTSPPGRFAVSVRLTDTPSNGWLAGDKTFTTCAASA